MNRVTSLLNTSESKGFTEKAVKNIIVQLLGSYSDSKNLASQVAAIIFKPTQEYISKQHLLEFLLVLLVATNLSNTEKIVMLS